MVGSQLSAKQSSFGHGLSLCARLVAERAMPSSGNVLLSTKISNFGISIVSKSMLGMWLAGYVAVARCWGPFDHRLALVALKCIRSTGNRACLLKTHKHDGARLRTNGACRDRSETCLLLGTSVLLVAGLRLFRRLGRVCANQSLAFTSGTKGAEVFTAQSTFRSWISTV